MRYPDKETMRMMKRARRVWRRNGWPTTFQHTVGNRERSADRSRNGYYARHRRLRLVLSRGDREQLLRPEALSDELPRA